MDKYGDNALQRNERKTEHVPTLLAWRHPSVWKSQQSSLTWNSRSNTNFLSQNVATLAELCMLQHYDSTFSWQNKSLACVCLRANMSKTKKKKKRWKDDDDKTNLLFMREVIGKILCLPSRPNLIGKLICVKAAYVYVLLEIVPP